MNKQSYEGFIPPSKLFANIYFVGVYAASTHLIETEEGLILIDAGLPETLWIVRDNIKELGFDEKDIKIILLSHGHYDHAGAAKELAECTGAKIYIGNQDLKMVTGEENTSLSPDKDYYKKSAFLPDVLLYDGDIVTLGSTQILCLSTPGHTKGTMSFFFDVTFKGKKYRAGMHGGVGLNTLNSEFLIANNIPFKAREEYVKSILYAKKQKVNVFLGNHVGNNNTEEKLKKVALGNETAFISDNDWTIFLNKRLENLKMMIQKETVDSILKEKIIVIVRGIKSEDILPFAEAVYKGGIRLLECTFDATGNIPDEEISKNIKLLSEKFEGKMTIGAGTVLTEKQVELTKLAGGKFIISPDTNPNVIQKTKELGLVSIPGALTPTEVAAAHRFGADFVKLFPISSLGVKYLKDISAPLSHIKFLAVGGVNLENIPEYMSAGALGIGIGSHIVNKQLIKENRFDEIQNMAEKYTAALKGF